MVSRTCLGQSMIGWSLAAPEQPWHPMCFIRPPLTITTTRLASTPCNHGNTAWRLESTPHSKQKISLHCCRSLQLLGDLLYSPHDLYACAIRTWQLRLTTTKHYTAGAGTLHTTCAMVPLTVRELSHPPLSPSTMATRTLTHLQLQDWYFRSCLPRPKAACCADTGLLDLTMAIYSMQICNTDLDAFPLLVIGAITLQNKQQNCVASESHNIPVSNGSKVNNGYYLHPMRTATRRMQTARRCQ